MVVIFDVVGTLFSLDRLRTAFRERGVPEDMLELWFARLLQSAMAVTLSGHYLPFKEAAESSLRQVLVAKGFPYDLSTPLLHALQELEPWVDAHECLQSLQEDGHRLVALTNSSEQVATSLLQRAGLRELFAGVYSSDAVGACKPHPAPYRMVLNRMKVPPPEACMVAAHGWDVAGAHAVGLNTIWISRLEKSWPFPGSPPGASVATLSEVPAVLFQQASAMAL